jgi:hypothetical protein
MLATPAIVNHRQLGGKRKEPIHSPPRGIGFVWLLPISADNAVAVGSPGDLHEHRMWAAMPHLRDRDHAST